ncbi:hypothetical protein V7O66_04750 [Methanolobus sp. ZRKC3]|uniref:phage late control D family protein n=1 Tax=Methanolobus sp. ZRKC3 TaxID=3125786 RepID=UPI003250D192
MEISGLDIYAPFFTVELAGKPEVELRDSIVSIEVDEDLEKPAMFTISLNEMFNVKEQKFKWLDDERIDPGTKFTISFGYASGSKKREEFVGQIKSVSPSFDFTGITKLNVSGYDLSHDLLKTTKKGVVKKIYKDIKYSDIAEDIAKKNNLKSKIESSEITYDNVNRGENESDYNFLRRLSEEIQYEFYVRLETLYFHKSRDNSEGDTTFELGKNIIKFNPRNSIANVVNEVEVTGWDDKNSIVETAKIADIKSKVGIPDFETIVKCSQDKKIEVIEDRVVRSSEEAKNLAIAELKKRNKDFIEGSLQCIGDPTLRPGITINIKKVGERFSGVYYITRTKHTIGSDGYKTELKIRRCL